MELIDLARLKIGLVVRARLQEIAERTRRSDDIAQKQIAAFRSELAAAKGLPKEFQAALEAAMREMDGRLSAAAERQAEAIAETDRRLSEIRIHDHSGDFDGLRAEIAGVRQEAANLGIGVDLLGNSLQSARVRLDALEAKEPPKEKPVPKVEFFRAGMFLKLKYGGEEFVVSLPPQEKRVIPGGLSEARVLELIEDNMGDSGEEEHTHAQATITASGNTDILVPASGKKLKIYWLTAISDPDSSDSPLIKLGFGTSGGSIADEKYRAYAIAKRQLMIGGTNEALIANLSASGSVAVTVIYDEIS